MKNKVFIIVGGIVILLGAFLVLASATKLYVQTTPPYIGFGSLEENYIPIPTKAAPSDYVTYSGIAGETALSLLQKNAYAEIGPSGLVVSINDRRADDSKKEFWAFYVNGEMAQVGPAEYVTNDGDKIEWRIEKY